MKLNTRYVALVGTAVLVSYAVADPGRGHAYGHSQAGSSLGATSSTAGSGAQFTSGAQLTSGDGTAVLPLKTSDEFFTTAGKVRTQGAEFVSAGAGQTASQKNDQGSQFLNSSGTNSNATAAAGSEKTATSKPSNVIDAATQKPDWVANASSGHGPKPKPNATPGGMHPSPSPTQNATPGATQSPSPAPTGTPFPTDVPAVFPSTTPEGHIMPPIVPGLAPKQPSTDPPPEI